MPRLGFGLAVALTSLAAVSAAGQDFAAIQAPPPYATFKAGSVVGVGGRAAGPASSPFRVEWARGSYPASGWSAAGVSLLGGGVGPGDGPLASWVTPTDATADYYTIRLMVENGGSVAESQAVVYLEPDLLDHEPLRLPRPVEGLTPWKPGGNVVSLPIVQRLADGYEPHMELWDYPPIGPKLEWPVNPPDPMHVQYRGRHAAGNIDGVPGEELPVPVDGVVRVVRPDRTTFDLVAAPDVDLSQATVTLADIDSDQRLEVLALGRGRFEERAFLYAWRGDGELVGPAFPIPLADTHLPLREGASPRLVVADLDRDGTKEIVVVEGVSPSTVAVRCFSPDGSPKPLPIPELPSASVALAVPSRTVFHGRRRGSLPLRGTPRAARGHCGERAGSHPVPRGRGARLVPGGRHSLRRLRQGAGLRRRFPLPAGPRSLLRDRERRGLRARDQGCPLPRARGLRVPGLGR